MIEFQFWKATSITLKVSAKSQEIFTKLTQNWNFIIQYDPPDPDLIKIFDF